MFALIMNATISPKVSSIPDIVYKDVVLNIYIYGKIWCC